MSVEQKIAALQPLLVRARTDITATRGPQGQRWHRDQPLTPERLASHLEGGPSRGVCPIHEGESTTRYAVLDFDDHTKTLHWATMSAVVATVVAALDFAWGAAPILWRSGGGSGVHLYLLWDEPQDAYSVRRWLGEVLISVGLHNGVGGVQARTVEVYPKQDCVNAGGCGSQVILPWARASIPLVLDELSNLLLPHDGGLEGPGAFTADSWTLSPPVPVTQRPVRVLPDPVSFEDTTPWRQALGALTNTEGTSLDYDSWRDCLFAIHHESQASEAGRALAHAWSARSGKYQMEMVDKVWDGATLRSGGITGKSVMRIASALAGWAEPIDMNGFVAVDERGRPTGRAAGGGGGGEGDDDLSGCDLVVLATGAVVPRDSLDEPEEVAERRGVPRAVHNCTDQANANRLVREYGARLLVAAGSWYVWDGRRWARDEGEVYRYACRLGAIIKDEAKKVRARAADGGPDAGKLNKAEELAIALEKWSTKSEMKGAIEAALGLTRKMLNVDSDTLDRSPWLLNVANGTVDLRTGVLRDHRLEDRITRLVDVRLRPGARSQAWEDMLRDVCCGDLALVGFMRRWLGYCCTGSTREQKFAVLWGGGGNGKSVLMGAVEEVLGEYSATAATELVVAKGGNATHSSAVAALVGKRMVTAHESGESGTLAESFIKKATGSDKMDARYLYGEQFSFMPTHKIQLLTNYKPTIKGQDRGIWRRVLLVPFVARFGSAEDVASGAATHLRDVLIGAHLAREEEKEGILADLVEAAGEWFREGLREPDAVRVAGEEYQGEQDRIGQFVNECCELSITFSEPLSGAMGSGLYPTYQGWCREGGILPVSKSRFMRDLERVVPYAKVEPGRTSVSEGRRKISRVVGIRLIPDLD